MKIACLQFDPRVGEVDNNLNRADAVLAEVDPDQLDGLDLLVLPELAFAGYNFTSLQHIAPCFEEAGSGITSLWAKTTALKHDCTVVVGYPEKVDVTANWPANPEYYNSAFIVNGDGDTVGNYRKSFLYYTDETWALEGGDGFFSRKIQGLGDVAMGICTDLNPYKLEAPWDAFEFGFHALKAQANLVILTMAWQTHEDASRFSHYPREPDLETLVYWVQRLEPLIRADNEDEVVVVFCNRTGAEGQATYTGTSAVIGIKRGEVFVYGVLGRGVNELLVVDTDQPPMSKLTDADTAEAEGHEYPVEQPALSLDTNMGSRSVRGVPDEMLPDDDQACRCHLAEPGPEPMLSSPRSPTSPRLPWLAQSSQPGETPTDARSPTRLQIPGDARSPTRLQIPTRPHFDEYMAMDSAITDDVIIDTPALPDAPGFSRRPLRPKLGIPASPWRFPSAASPYPWHHHDGSRSAVFGGGATMTPITPFDEDGWSSTPIDPKGPAPWFWRHEPTLSALKESIVEEEEPSESPKAQPLRPIAEDRHEPSSEEVAPRCEEDDKQIDLEEEPPREEDPESAPLNNDWADLADVLEGLKELKARPGSAFDFRSSREDRPSSTKSRNLSRNPSPFRLFQSSELDYGGEWDDSPAAGALDLGPYRPASPRTAWEEHGTRGDSPHVFAGPSSKAGHRLIQRSDSFDVSAGKQHGEGVPGRRQPSRLRHAVFFPDEDESDVELDYDSEPEYHRQQGRRRRSVSRGRQRETSRDRQTSAAAQETRHYPASQWGDYQDEEADSPVSEHNSNNNTPPFPTATQQPSRWSLPLPAVDTDTYTDTKNHENGPPTSILSKNNHHQPSPLSIAAIQHATTTLPKTTTTTTTTTNTPPSLHSATASVTSTASPVTADDYSPVTVPSTTGSGVGVADSPGDAYTSTPMEKGRGVFGGAGVGIGRQLQQQQQQQRGVAFSGSGGVKEGEGVVAWAGRRGSY